MLIILFTIFFFFLFCNKNQNASQQTMERESYENYGFDLLSGSSRTTLKQTNGMAPIWCVYAIACSRIL